MKAVLRTRQLIPPLTARTPAGQTIRAWDFKQKKNLVVVFLDAAHPETEEFIQRLMARTAEIAEQEAIALVVFSGNPPVMLPTHLPAEIIVATDMSGRAARAYLGEDAFGVSGQQRSGAFVADRYGDLHAQWVVSASAGGALPGIGEILSYLRQIELACEECGVSHWAVGE
jgi:hypothetical protein